MKLIALLTLAVLIVGCNPGTTESKAPENQAGHESGKGTPSSSQPSGGGDNVQVLTGGAGAAGAAPVVGGENLGSGSGGGVGDAAKNAARKAAGKSQPTGVGDSNGAGD